MNIIRLIDRHILKCQHYQHKVVAFIIKGGKIISTGHNHSHIHAEQSAIDNAFGSNIRNSTMIVVRIRRDGKFGIAKPCDMCSNELFLNGIKKVIYTNQGGNFEALKITSLSSRTSYGIQFRHMLWYKCT